MKKHNLIETVFEQMTTDDGANQKQSDRLERLYNEGNDKDKFTIDEVLMCLCGWSFKTIQKKGWEK